MGIKKKILIIDDEECVLAILSKILPQEDYRVYTALNVQETLKLAKNIEFDLIISDMFIQEDTGLDLIAQMRKIQPEMKTIIMSGNRNFEKLELDLLSIDDFIPKPFDLNKVRATVEKVLSEE